MWYFADVCAIAVISGHITSLYCYNHTIDILPIVEPVNFYNILIVLSPRAVSMAYNIKILILPWQNLPHWNMF